MRAAIGAGRGRLIRQMLTESLLLGLAGGAAGCALGWALVRLFVRLSPEGMLRMDQAHVDLRVLAFALLAALAAALLFGLAPALEQPRAEALAGRGRDRNGAHVPAPVPDRCAGGHLAGAAHRRFAVCAQPLEAGRAAAGLPFATPRHRVLHPSPPALPAAGRAVGLLRPHWSSASQPFPVAASFALTDSIPPRGSMGRPYSNIRILGHPPVAANGGMVAFRWVSPDISRPWAFRFSPGARFLESERASGDSPVILSATLARRLFGRESPLGQQLILDGDGQRLSHRGRRGGRQECGRGGSLRTRILPPPHGPSARLGRGGVAVFRTSLDPALLSRWIRHEFAVLDPTLPVDIQTMEERVDRFRQRPRFIAAVLAAFASVGLLLAALGLYGLLAFLVARQTREIGVRMALGACPRDIALRVQWQAAAWIAAGIVLGLAGSLALSGVIRGLLFEISPADPLSLAIPAVTLCAAGGLAAWLPSRRAARVDPVIALRFE